MKKTAVLSPAGGMDAAEFDSAVRCLQQMGMPLKIMPSARRSSAVVPGYLAADDAQRAADLSAAWFDDEVELILCSRGGYGSVRLLELLDWDRMRRVNKMVVGFSDITALHWAMTRHCAGTVIAGPMLKYLAAQDEFTLQSFSAALEHREINLSLPSLNGGNAVSGRVLAGNIAVAASLCGTRFFPDTSGRILLLEEIGEAPYRIDRMLCQLRMAGAFEKVKAVLFGSFTDCGNKEELLWVLRDFARRMEFPVFTGACFGHTMPMQSFSEKSPVNISVQ